MFSSFINTAHAMAGQPGGGGGQAGGFAGLTSLLLPMAVVFGIFYLLLIRPQQKQAKKVKVMLESMRKGDFVITRSGIHGKVVNLLDNNVAQLEIAENVKIKINKDQIGFVKPPAE